MISRACEWSIRDTVSTRCSALRLCSCSRHFRSLIDHEAILQLTGFILLQFAVNAFFPTQHTNYIYSSDQ